LGDVDMDAYLDPTILAECGDEELRKVYELRQRTSKSEKWERKRCRELLSLKLDERGVLGITSLPYIFFFHASSTFCRSVSPSVSFSTLSFFSDYPTYPPPPRPPIVLPYSLPIHTKYFV
jgi:hypothetical protein